MHMRLGKNDYVFPSQQTLAEDTGLSRRTVVNIVKRLSEVYEIIEIEPLKRKGRKHGNHSNLYRFQVSMV